MSRTEHMMLSLWGVRWKEIVVMPFTVYLDDSGTDPSQHVAIASALAIPAARLLALEREWDRFRAKENFSSFHMSEFAALNSKSEFANWGSKQERVAARVRQIIKKYAVKAFSMSVNKADYEEIMPQELRRYVGKFHYSWAICSVLSFVEKWASEATITSPLEYIFDCMGPRSDPRRQEIEDIMELSENIASEEGKEGHYANYSFRDRRQLPALQCADVMAWTCYQHALYVFRNTPMKPLAEIMWEDLHSDMNWLWAFTIKRDDLKKWAQRELADGRSLRRYQAWESQKTAKQSKGAHAR